MTDMHGLKPNVWPNTPYNVTAQIRGDIREIVQREIEQVTIGTIGAETPAGAQEKVDTSAASLTAAIAAAKAELQTADALLAPLVHTHDDRYYLKAQVDASLAGKAAAVHSHNDLYYTEVEVDALIAGVSGGAGWTPVNATTTTKGIVELATTTEATTGTDTTRATTPAGVKAALDAKTVSDMSTYATKDELAAVGAGGFPIQNVTITTDVTVGKTTWPTDQIVTAVLVQDAAGGHTVTHGGALASGVVWSPGQLPGSETVTTWRHSPTLDLWVVEGCWISVAGSESADTTPPTAGTLSSSAVTGSSFTLTVTGATDAGGLHAQPYRFSLDNGSTWSAWQTSEHYAASGLDASTAHTCKHQTRDAALNTVTGTAITVTTTTPDPENVAPSWSATFTMGAPTSTGITATASAMATDDTAVTGYEVSYDDGSTWATITPSGSVFSLTGTASTTYATTKLRAVDGDGATSTALAVPSYTLAAEPTSLTLTYRSSHVGTSATGVTIGTAPGGGETRTVLVMAMANAVDEGGVAPTGCTIGGVTATRDYFTDRHEGGDGTGAAVAVFRAEVPTGTTADVTITGGSTGNTRMFHVWTVDGGVTPVDFDAKFYPVGTTVTVDTVNGGFIIAAATGGFGTSGQTWSANVTARLSGTMYHAAADDTSTTGSTDNVSFPVYRPTVAAAAYGPAA